MKHIIYYFLFILTIILGFSLVSKSFLLLAIFAALIIAGSLIIAWAAESSEVMISQGLALAFVALIQIFPEFMIEATIAWARDIPNMLSNFTGANRILIGIGWPLVFFTMMAFSLKKNKKLIKEINLEKEHSIEVIFLMIATVYSFLILLRGSLSLFDAVFMILLYATYLFITSKLPHVQDENLISGIPKKISSMPRPHAIITIVIMFLFGGAILFFVAEPFYNHSLIIATTLGLSQFLFLQWVAPFLSEFPEKTSAFYWASTIKKAPMAIMNLISSILSQWTLLLAMLPIVFSISSGAVSSIPLSTPIAGTSFTLATEFLLTIATSLYASIFLLKMRFTLVEATSLLALWIIQFIWVSSRPTLILVYFGLSVLEIVIYRKEINKVFKNARKVFLEINN